MSILGNNLLAQYYAQNQYGLYIPTKLGYVTDGLVAMWDGEYNAGNRHNPNATSWKDCVGGMTLNWLGSGTYQWENKCCHIFGEYPTDRFGANFGSLLGESHQEICTAWRTMNNIGTSRFSVNGQDVYIQDQGTTVHLISTSYNLSDTSAGYKTGWGSNMTKDSNYTMSTPFSLYAASAYIYQNAVKDTSAQNTGTTSRNLPRDVSIGLNFTPDRIFRGESVVYCCRLYNRHLTDAEVAQNYAVDLARFGTTYQP